MDSQAESGIKRIERKLARTQLVVGILWVSALISHYPTLNKMFGETILALLLVSGVVAVTVFVVYGLEQLFSNKK
jgi:hypothetical protein